MELVTFESKAYKELAEKLDRIAQYVVKKETDQTSNFDQGDSIMFLLEKQF